MCMFGIRLTIEFKSHFQSKIQVLLFVPAAATVVELDSISYKFVSIPGTLLLSGSGQALSRSCYGITRARLS